jgi:hypothetical protein
LAAEVAWRRPERSYMSDRIAEVKEIKTAKEFLDLLTKEEEEVLLDALSSNHKFTEHSDPSE